MREDEDKNATNGLVNEVSEPSTQASELPFHFICSGTREVSVSACLTERRPTGAEMPSFTYRMDRRMSHTLPAFELDDVLEGLRWRNIDRVSFRLQSRVARRSRVL
jgi:hypothetical protein